MTKMRNKKNLQFITAALAVVSAAVFSSRGMDAAAAPTPSATSLLQAMMRAEQTTAYSATEIIVRQNAPTMKIRVWRDGIKKRFEYLEPPVMKGDLLVDNGSRVWRYHHAEKSAVQTKTAAHRRLSVADQREMSQRFNARVLRREVIAGRPAWVVAVTPRNSHQVARQFGIDTETKVRLRLERFAPDGTRVEVSSLQNVSFVRPETSLFEWKPPAGVRQSSAGTLFLQLEPARRAANWLRPPTQLPRGYGLESVIVDPKGEAWFRYTNGLNRFSIFQQRSGDDKERGLQQVAGGWYWQRGGNRFFIVGLSGAAVRQVAGSVR